MFNLIITVKTYFRESISFFFISEKIEIMTHQNEIKLFLYDYQLVGTTMGTHSAVIFNGQEYWYRYIESYSIQITINWIYLA